MSKSVRVFTGEELARVAQMASDGVTIGVMPIRLGMTICEFMNARRDYIDRARVDDCWPLIQYALTER